jgi:hypothetical protein
VRVAAELARGAGIGVSWPAALTRKPVIEGRLPVVQLGVAISPSTVSPLCST